MLLNSFGFPKAWFSQIPMKWCSFLIIALEGWGVAVRKGTWEVENVARNQLSSVHSCNFRISPCLCLHKAAYFWLKTKFSERHQQSFQSLKPEAWMSSLNFLLHEPQHQVMIQLPKTFPACPFFFLNATAAHWHIHFSPRSLPQASWKRWRLGLVLKDK